MAGKPTAAFILALIGGIFILLGGLVMGTFGAVVLGLQTMFHSTPTASNVAFSGMMGILFGVIVIILSALMYVSAPAKPQRVKMFGVAVLVLGILSIWTALAGLLIGLILTVVGGILGIIYKPKP
jgi:glucan phosphoethanolaminetransferase (alkaline phosphatase superfamily)